MAERLLITSALPYANGPIHVGHLVEYVQTDIYVRFLRSCGRDVIFLCADDTHGTPIELNAAKQGLPPEKFVAQFFEQHQADFRDFDVKFDCFWTTNSPENKHYAELIYSRLKAAGDIDRRDIEQYWCPNDRRFLPDRFIRGTCPNCKSPDQYGDVCEKCGKAYSPTDLIDPRCALCGSTPILRKSTHLFFRLSKHTDFLLGLIRNSEFLNPGIASQLQSFFEKGLADWDITRDGPYFGFPIPGEENKFFYVWLDAPIGYIAATERWAQQTGKAKDALSYWGVESEAKIFHFIGKDIVYFHALFWPAVLKVANLKRPSRLMVHGHLTVNGEKMSKTRGNFITARTYLEHLDPSYLRYFYAANLGAGPEDLDLSLKEFRLRVNADLANNIGNLANRTLSMLANSLERRLASAGPGTGRDLVEDALRRSSEVRDAFERLEYRAAIKAIAEIAQAANQFLQIQAPWAKLKAEPEVVRRVLSDAAEIVYLLAGLLSPVVPRLAEKLFEQLGAPALTFERISGAKYPLLDRNRFIGLPAPLIARLEEAQVSPILSPDDTTSPVAQVDPPKATAAESEEAPQIEYTDFARVVLKVGTVLSAERLPKADKLLKLSVDLGEGSPRTIIAGIAEAYSPEPLVGKNVVVVSNLKPRVLRGIESRGMILTAGPGGAKLALIDPGSFPPGTEVK
jgi:methionyl-tRNA synthetase